jgi:hypothetical protein
MLARACTRSVELSIGPLDDATKLVGLIGDVRLLCELNKARQHVL